MTKPIVIYLPQNERRLLLRLSVDDLREPDAQIRWLVINEAARRGILPPTDTTDTLTATPQREAVPA